jgi:hypothetical protein
MPLGGSLSIDSQLKAGLAELECSNAVFIAIAQKSSTSKLSQSFCGIKALETTEALALKEVLDQMRSLQADIAAHVGYPIPIAWKASMRDVLEARRRAPRLWALDLGSGFFVRRQRLTGEIVCDRREQAALSLADATKLQQELKTLGYSARLVPARECEQSELEDVWQQS